MLEISEKMKGEAWLINGGRRKWENLDWKMRKVTFEFHSLSYNYLFIYFYVDDDVSCFNWW
jgi:hypothetical protein